MSYLRKGNLMGLLKSKMKEKLISEVGLTCMYCGVVADSSKET